MSIKIIPEKRITICDCCGISSDGSIRFLRKQEGRLLIRQNAQAEGALCRDIKNVEFDLCDRCFHTVNQAINDTMTMIRGCNEDKSADCESAEKMMMLNAADDHSNFGIM